MSYYPSHYHMDPEDAPELPPPPCCPICGAELPAAENSQRERRRYIEYVEQYDANGNILGMVALGEVVEMEPAWKCLACGADEIGPESFA